MKLRFGEAILDDLREIGLGMKAKLVDRGDTLV